MKVVVYKHLQKDVKDIREEVFMKEQGFENEFDDLDAISTFVVVYDNNLALATGRFYPSEKGYVIGRVAVVKPYRKQGIGQLVIRSLEQEIGKNGAAFVELSAQQRVQGFYEGLGYTVVGGVYMDEHCPHVRMVKEIV